MATEGKVSPDNLKPRASQFVEEVARTSSFSPHTVKVVLSAFWSLMQEDLKKGLPVRIPYSDMMICMVIKQYPYIPKKAISIRGLWPHLEPQKDKIKYEVVLKLSVWRLFKKMHKEKTVIFPSI